MTADATPLPPAEPMTPRKRRVLPPTPLLPQCGDWPGHFRCGLCGLVIWDHSGVADVVKLGRQHAKYCPESPRRKASLTHTAATLAASLRNAPTDCENEPTGLTTGRAAT